MTDLDHIKEFALDKPSGWNVFGSAEDVDQLPEEHKAQIFFLNRKANKFLYEYLKNSDLLSGPIWDPFQKGNFQSVEEFTDLENDQALKKWLYSRGIPFQNWVLLLPNYSEDPVYLTWKMVVKYCPLIFDSMDDIAIFDKTNNWCLFYFHEEHLYFGKNHIYHSEEGYRKMEELYDRKKKFPKFRHPLIPD